MDQFDTHQLERSPEPLSYGEDRHDLEHRLEKVLCDDITFRPTYNRHNRVAIWVKSG